MGAVEHWLHQQKDLNLNRGLSYSTHANQIWTVELQIPNKTDVLSYFDGGGSEPTRYARATLLMNSKDASTYNDILVGPLPISSATTWEPLTFPYTSKTGSIRNISFKSGEWYKRFEKALHAVRNITNQLWPGPGVRASSGDGMR
jgi:primary-amine oxidase